MVKFRSDTKYMWLATINISLVKGRVTLTEVIKVMNIDPEIDATALLFIMNQKECSILPIHCGEVYKF